MTGAGGVLGAAAVAAVVGAAAAGAADGVVGVAIAGEVAGEVAGVVAGPVAGVRTGAAFAAGACAGFDSDAPGGTRLGSWVEIGVLSGAAVAELVVPPPTIAASSTAPVRQAWQLVSTFEPRFESLRGLPGDGAVLAMA